MRFEGGDDIDGAELPAGAFLHGGDRGVDLRADFEQQRQQRVGFAAGDFGLAARLDEHAAEAGDGGLRFRRGAGGFLGRGGDLFERAAQLLGRGRGFGDTGGQFLGGGADAFGGFLLAGAGAGLGAALGVGWLCGWKRYDRLMHQRPAQGAGSGQIGRFYQGHTGLRALRGRGKDLDACSQACGARSRESVRC